MCVHTRVCLASHYITLAILSWRFDKADDEVWTAVYVEYEGRPSIPEMSLACWLAGGVGWAPRAPETAVIYLKH